MKVVCLFYSGKILQIFAIETLFFVLIIVFIFSCSICRILRFIYRKVLLCRKHWTDSSIVLIECSTTMTRLRTWYVTHWNAEHISNLSISTKAVNKVWKRQTLSPVRQHANWICAVSADYRRSRSEKPTTFAICPVRGCIRRKLVKRQGEYVRKSF